MKNTMKYRPLALGGAGARVSELGLGAMTFGEADAQSMMHGVSASEEEAHRIMSRALDAGVNFWDTANVYGQDGLSERVVGSWLRKNGHRHDVVLATKCRFGMGPGPNDRGASRLHIKRALDESLRRLGVEHVDLLQIHMQDAKTPEEEVVRALDDLQRDGKIHYFGASNYAAYRLVESLWQADRNHLGRFVTLQAQYSLIERNVEYEHVPALRRFGLGLLPWSPLGGGFLTGKYRKEGGGPEGARLTVKKERLAARGTERNFQILAAVEAVAREVGATPGQVSLGWLLRRPTVSSIILGVRSLAQLEEGLAACDVALPEAILARLDEASAPPARHPYDMIKGVDGTW